MSKFEDATLDIKKLDGGVNDGVTADLIGDDQWSYARNIYGSEGSILSRNGRKRLGTLSQGSLKLDGTGDYLTIPDSATFEFADGAFTIDVWAYFTDITTVSKRAIIAKYIIADDKTLISFFLGQNKSNP